MNTLVSGELYAQVQHFYAHQMQALDNGRLEEHANTFTEDGTFALTPGAAPAVGPDAILEELRLFMKQFESDPTQLRHHFNQIRLAPQEDGSIASTVYALIVRTRPAEAPEVGPSIVIHDVIDMTDDRIRLRSRSVSYDQLA
ncbi:nuclear transport factor 2 family protein [Streptomyces sp. NPDC006430]|uniref:nuclear transport factor 2 family protein n=1 Tax=Streptomyces sp. NPDC006430 TaxID=3154299 RepID=UPI0033BA8E7A